jgi:ABC-type multidrug transport system fused ATPase/permease subunit
MIMNSVTALMTSRTAEGTHTELIAKGGMYADLVQHQIAEEST